MLDRYKVNTGDRVFDVQLGWGTVERVTPEDGYIVSFRGRTATYISGGYFGINGPKRLFWQDVTSILTPRPGKSGLREIEFAKQVITYARQLATEQPQEESDDL